MRVAAHPTPLGVPPSHIMFVPTGPYILLHLEHLMSSSSLGTRSKSQRLRYGPIPVRVGSRDEGFNVCTFSPLCASPLRPLLSPLRAGRSSQGKFLSPCSLDLAWPQQVVGICCWLVIKCVRGLLSLSLVYRLGHDWLFVRFAPRYALWEILLTLDVRTLFLSQPSPLILLRECPRRRPL